jgi:peptide/nickel transport system substrate-binding protein
MLRLSAIRAASLCLLAAFAPAAQARTRSHYGGTIRIEIQGDPWQTPDGLARRLILDRLTAIDESGAVEPALAIHWESQNSDHRWEFQLRPDVRFHDGAPLTAESVVASLNQTCSAPGAACPWRAVRPLGAGSVVFVTDSASPDLPELLAQTEFGIARQESGAAVQGTGPWRVTGFADGALTLAASDDSWHGRPFADTVEIRPHRAIRDQWLDLSVGRTDMVEVPPELLRQAQQQHFSVLISRPVDLLALLIQSKGVFATREIREAAALSVDRAALCNVIFQKQGEISGSLLPASLSGYTFLFPVDRNLEWARALRGGAGGAPLTLAAESSTATMQVAADRLVLNLHEAGFNVQPAAGNHEPAALVLRRIHLQAVTPRAALDEMLARAGESAIVTGSSPQALYQAERNALDTSTVVPLLWLPRAWAAGDRIRDLRLTVDGVPDLADASLEAGK